MTEKERIVAYKGFDKDLKCSGFQYEVGGKYETDAAEVRESGFHACAQPLEVLQYYSPKDGARYCLVEQSGEISRDRNGTKAASTELAVKAEIGLTGLVKAQMKWAREKKPKETASGYCGTAAASGRRGTAVASGDCGIAAASGEHSAAMAVGIDGRVKGAAGCAIFAVERGKWNGSGYPILSAASAIVDGEAVKADTWYQCRGGKLVEVEEDD